MAKDVAKKAYSGLQGAVREALIVLSQRLVFDDRHGCYRLDGRPATIQELLRAAEITETDTQAGLR